MNRNEHLISSLLLLVVTISSYLTMLLREYGTARIIGTFIFSLIFFLWGCILPDIDHPKVHEKIFFLRWLGKVSHHRGHFHSIIAMLVYGLLIALLMFLINLYYWIPPTLFGVYGYFSHLVEDDMNRYKLKSKPSRGVKIW